jgi:ABC-type antimicrobial peptide transport system permease subunit
VSRIYVTFAIIAILISCLGLFALSLFDIRQRYREIALRKINGATAKDIRHLLLKKYVYLLAIAFVIAVPLVFFVISKYMESFVHRTAISWWLFAISAIIVAAISLITLLWQIKKAMKVNPARVFGAG